MKKTISIAFVIKYDQYEGQEQFSLGVECKDTKRQLASVEVYNTMEETVKHVKEVQSIGYINDIHFVAAS